MPDRGAAHVCLVIIDITSSIFTWSERFLIQSARRTLIKALRPFIFLLGLQAVVCSLGKDFDQDVGTNQPLPWLV